MGRGGCTAHRALTRLTQADREWTAEGARSRLRDIVTIVRHRVHRAGAPLLMMVWHCAVVDGDGTLQSHIISRPQQHGGLRAPVAAQRMHRRASAAAEPAKLTDAGDVKTDADAAREARKWPIGRRDVLGDGRRGVGRSGGRCTGGRVSECWRNQRTIGPVTLAPASPCDRSDGRLGGMHGDAGSDGGRGSRADGGGTYRLCCAAWADFCRRTTTRDSWPVGSRGGSRGQSGVDDFLACLGSVRPSDIGPTVPSPPSARFLCPRTTRVRRRRRTWSLMKRVGKCCWGCWQLTWLNAKR